MAKCDAPRSYMVKSQGKVLRRNRRFLAKSSVDENAKGTSVSTSECSPPSEPQMDKSTPTPSLIVTRPPEVPAVPVVTTRRGRIIKRPSRYDD